MLRFSGFDEVSNCVGDDGFVGILTINMRVGATAGGWGWFGGYGEDAPIVQEVRSEWIKCAENIEGSSGRE